MGIKILTIRLINFSIYFRREMNPEKGKTPRKSKKGNGKKRSKFMMKAGKKPKGGKGIKNPKITSVGRKRR